MTDSPQDRRAEFLAAITPRLRAAGLNPSEDFGSKSFFAVVLPLLEEAGYVSYGRQQRLSEATGMSPGTASRLFRGQTVPDIQTFPALAEIVGLTPLELLVLAGHFPKSALESQQPLSESDQSQVGSDRITPESAADSLGFNDDVRRAIFVGFVESLRKTEPEAGSDGSGGAAAEM
ncbi:helix-turn-helix domain-containing protein [Streptomyces sp. NPDC001781]